jgi:PAS domain-containing protein
MLSVIIKYMTEGEIDADSGVRTASNSGVVYELNLQSSAMKWSEALYTVFNYPHTEPFNRLEWWIQHIHPDDAMLLNEALDNLTDPKNPGWTVTYRFRAGDGSYVPVQDHASVVRNENDVAVSIIGTVTPTAAGASSSNV